jgi:hypothetical protein
MKSLTPLFALTLLLAQAHADPVEDAIKAALSSYKAGKNTEAVDQLKKASDLINEKAGNTLTTALPKTIGGWNGGKITTKTLSEIGGGQGAERNYRKGDKEDPKSLTATVSIISGSPAMTQISGFLSNPALGVLIGAKSQQVGSATALVIPKEGLLQMVVQDKFVVAVRGKKLSETQLAELAAGVNQDVLKALK